MLKRFYRELRASPFIKHNAVFFTGSLLVSFINYLFYPVLGRMLNPAEFGEVQTLLSLFAQAAILLNILTYVTIHITVNTPDEAERNHTLLGLEYTVLFASSLLLIPTILLAPFLKNFLNFSSVWPFIALVIAVACSIPLILRMAFLRGRKLFAKSSLIDGIGSLAKLLLAMLLVAMGWGSFGAIMGLAISQVISLIFGLHWAKAANLKGIGIKKGDFRFKHLAPQLRYALAVFLVSFSVTTLMSLDMISVKHFFEPTQAGQYAGITTTARIVYFLTAPFTGVMLTMVSLRQDKRKNKLQVTGAIGLVLGVGGLIVLSMALFAEPIVNIVVGSKYLIYAPLLSKLALTMLLLACANVVLMYQIALRRFLHSLAPIAAIFLTIILMGLRHNSVGLIVDNVLIGSVMLLVITTAQLIYL